MAYQKENSFKPPKQSRLISDGMPSNNFYMIQRHPKPIEQLLEEYEEELK